MAQCTVLGSGPAGPRGLGAPAVLAPALQGPRAAPGAVVLGFSLQRTEAAGAAPCRLCKQGGRTQLHVGGEGATPPPLRLCGSLSSPDVTVTGQRELSSFPFPLTR